MAETRFCRLPVALSTIVGRKMWDVCTLMNTPETTRHLKVDVHRSLHPDEVQIRLDASLKQGFIPTRMLYETPRQVRMWQALVAAFSPSVQGGDGFPAYEEIHQAAAEATMGASVQLVGLACGDGRKEESLAAHLASRETRTVSFAPIEGSLPLMQLAASRLTQLIPGCLEQAILADLEAVGDRALGLVERPAGSVRLLTLYGVLPWMDPDAALSSAKNLLGPGDLLLVSSNSEPIETVQENGFLGQYENDLTRDWIGMMLDDLGMGSLKADVRFQVQMDPKVSGVKNISATVCHPDFMELTVFRSSRQSPEALKALLKAHDLDVVSLSVSPSGEETIALARPRA
jgi:hypothetical protein